MGSKVHTRTIYLIRGGRLVLVVLSLAGRARHPLVGVGGPVQLGGRHVQQTHVLDVVDHHQTGLIAVTQSAMVGEKKARFSNVCSATKV